MKSRGWTSWASWRVEDAEKQEQDDSTNDGGECVGCGRIMSVRERNEQGVCNDCASVR